MPGSAYIEMDSDSKSAAANIWLTRKEQRLRESLDQGDMPVLGLYIDHFSPEDREYFRSKVLGSEDPVKSFIRGLGRWPATFATFLTVHLVEGYGQSGNAEVYPYIETALGIGEHSLGPKDRGKLAAAYRRACITLGLSTAPSGEGGRAFVDEYLRQVGVPVPYFKGLFEGLAKVARRYGVPDTDDPNDLVAWQGYVDIPSTRPVLRRAVENDSAGYYAGLFFRVSEFAHESDCDNAIEQAAFQAYKELGQAIGKRKALIPALSWRDDELGILLPSGDDTRWSISVVGIDGETSSMAQVQGGSDPRFIPVGTQLARQCKVLSGALNFVFQVWESAADNQLVIFDRGGKFVARGYLGGNSISLNPGTYTVVSRWRPQEFGDAAHSVSEEVTLFASQLDLVAGQTVELARGPAKVQVVTRSVPSLSWEGQRLVGMTGREIYWGPNLAIRVSIPSEVLETAAHGFELIVSQPHGKECVVPLSAGLEGTVDIPIVASLLELGSGLQRVRIRLRRPDIPNRALATVTGFVWPEMVSVAVGRLTADSDAAFENFDSNTSDNVKLEGNSLTYSDGAQRFYRTVFKVGSEDVAFQWPVPGVFVALEETKDGRLIEHPIQKRGVVQIRPSSRQRLKVYSASDGILRLGAFKQEIKSALFGGAQIYLSNLVEFLSPEDQTLQLEIPGAQYSEELVRFVTPHQVLEFASTRSSETYVLEFFVSGELTEVSIDAWDLLSGKREELRVEADAVSLSGNPFQKASLATSKEGQKTRATLAIPLPDWADGLWVLP